MDRKLKVGDKLVVKKNLPGVFGIYVDDVLTVTNIDVEGKKFKANSPNGDNAYIYNDRIGEFLVFAEVEKIEAHTLTYREQLAAKIFVVTFSDNSNDNFNPRHSFRAADAFIAELESQRKRNRSTLGSNVDISA